LYSSISNMNLSLGGWWWGVPRTFSSSSLP
jgi:hypothetical protein